MMMEKDFKLEQAFDIIAKHVEQAVDNLTLDNPKVKQAYDDWLDEVGGEINFSMVKVTFSEVLEKFDPVAYNVGFQYDWKEGLGISEYTLELADGILISIQDEIYEKFEVDVPINDIEQYIKDNLDKIKDYIENVFI